MTRGEIWWADLGVPCGSEPGFRRPVLIVQADSFKGPVRTGIVSGQGKETGSEIDTQPSASQVIQSQNTVDARTWRQSVGEDREVRPLVTDRLHNE